MLIHQVGEKNWKCRRRTRPLCALVSLYQPSLSYHPCSVLRVARSHQLLNQLFGVSVVRFILNHNQRRFHHTVSASMPSYSSCDPKNRIIKMLSTYRTKATNRKSLALILKTTRPPFKMFTLG